MPIKTEADITDWTWYDQRFDGVIKGVRAMRNYYDPADITKRPNVERRATVALLLKQLDLYGSAHFNFFRSRLEEGSLTPHPKFPLGRVLDAIIRQISYDAEVILRAAQQHQMQEPDIHDTLKKADQMAYVLLQSLVSYLESTPGQTNWTALTYFQKTPQIRVVPYANIALIGIPWSCISTPRDYLAIAHEIGHIAYWRRVIQDKGTGPSPIDKSYVTKPDVAQMYVNWQEEIFADALGCRLMGAVMALDFQSVSLEYDFASFLAQNDEHPAPIRRPLLYAKALDQLETDAKVATPFAAKLAARWLDRVSARVESAGGLAATDGDAYTTIDRAQKDSHVLDKGKGMDKTLWYAMDAMSDLPKDDWTGDKAAFQAALDADSGTGEEYAGFDDVLKERVKNAPADLDVIQVPEVQADDSVTLWDKLLEREKILQGHTLADFTARNPMPSGEITDLSGIPNGTWMQIWLAAGWTTEEQPTDKQP